MPASNVDANVVMRMFELKDRIMRANAKVIEFQQKIPIVKTWRNVHCRIDRLRPGMRQQRIVSGVEK